MPRIPPVSIDELPQGTQALLKAGEAFMGFMPNDALVMAHQPAVLPAFLNLVKAVYSTGTLEPGFKRLIGMVASSAAGCDYCEAHTAFAASQSDVALEKIAAVWEYETSALFSAAERAALRVAQRAALTPSAVEDDDFKALSEHYSDEEMTEILSVISLFGFLNRWNSAIQTDIEALPAALRAQVEKERQ